MKGLALNIGPFLMPLELLLMMIRWLMRDAEIQQQQQQPQHAAVTCKNNPVKNFIQIILHAANEKHRKMSDIPCMLLLMFTVHICYIECVCVCHFTWQ